MTISEWVGLARRFAQTLKFRVVLIGVALTIAVTAVTTAAVLSASEHQMERAVLDAEADGVATLARVVAAHLDSLEATLAMAAGRVTPRVLADRAELDRTLVGFGALRPFERVAVADAQGRVLAQAVGGHIRPVDFDVAGRPYFQRALADDGTLVVEAVTSRLTGQPALIVALPLRDAHGRAVAVLWGAFDLGASPVLGRLADREGHERRTIVVFDRDEHIVAHPDAARLLGEARGEPGLDLAIDAWQRADDDTRARGPLRADGRVVALAEVLNAGWTIASAVGESAAFAAIAEGRAAAWKVGAFAALFAAIVTIAAMTWLTRPVERLRERAHKLLTDRDDVESDWPEVNGEIGDLAHVFLHILRERSAVESSTMQLLTRLQAVLDNASVGIAFARDRRFELTSRTFCSMLGYDAFEMMGGPTRMVSRTAEEYAQLDGELSAALDAGESFSGEALFVRKDGTPFWGHLLGRSLDPGDPAAGTIWILEDVTEDREMRERLTWTATHDALTGLVNRREFDRRLHELVGAAAQAPFCAMFMDLDRFKAVNDTAGHAAGDRLLCDLSKIVEQSVRHADTAARIGGDEFAVLLEGCPRAVAETIAEKIRAAIAGYRLNWNGADFSVGISIGLVEVTDAFTTHEAVMQAADAACYAAKRAGRNRVCIYGVDTGAGAQAAVNG